jgi:two-component system sensor histidine kinase DegS
MVEAQKPRTGLLDEYRGLVEKSIAGKQRFEAELNEINALLRQTNIEVEKLTQRSMQAKKKLREIEANIDGFSRLEIANAYGAAQDAELRLFSMKSQLEQLQYKQQALEKNIDQLQQFLKIADQVASRLEEARPPAPAPEARPLAGREVSEQQYVSQVLQAQEAERKRLSRQMHDGPAQSLTNLILRAEICERLLSSDPAAAKAELANLKAMVNTTFQRTRGFIFQLRPMILDDLGLVPTLRKYIQFFQEQSKLAVTLDVTGKERRLPAQIEVGLFRIVQEALNNVAEHAKASSASVSVDLEPEAVVLTVQDDGIGFDPAETMKAAQARGSLGIHGIQQRAESLGGAVSFESEPGKGARVLVNIPV